MTPSFSVFQEKRLLFSVHTTTQSQMHYRLSQTHSFLVNTRRHRYSGMQLTSEITLLYYSTLEFTIPSKMKLQMIRK